MAPLLLLPFAAIYYHPVASAVEVDWLCAPSSAQLREAALFALRLAEQMQARAWIDDVSLLGTLPALDQQWLNEVWGPLLAATAVSAFAVVLPTSFTASLVDESEADVLEDGPFCTHYFSNRHDARRWVNCLP